MMHLKETFSAFALVVPFVVGALVATAATSSASATLESPDLCTAAGIDTGAVDSSGACVYAAWDSPVFKDEVCWDGAVAVVKGDASCSPGQTAHMLIRGEVIDVDTGEVAAYAALPNSCKYAPCEPMIQGQIYEDGVACCSPAGDCTPPDANGMCPLGDVTWCKELEDNGDGTVTCHE